MNVLRGLVVASSLLCIAGLVACGGPAPAAPVTPAPPPAPRPAAPPPAPAPAGPVTTFSLLTPGAEPRLARSYAFAVGKRARRLITLRQSAGREGEPAMGAAFALTVELRPSSPTRFDLELLAIDMVDAPGAIKAQVQSSLAKVAGLKGGFDITSRGVIGDLDLTTDTEGEGAEVVARSLEQSLELLAPPFPVEPVGVGAKWRRTIEAEGVRPGPLSSSTQTFTLTDVSAEGGTVTAEMEVRVPKHGLQPARGVPKGATEEVLGKGAYSFAFRFDDVASKVAGDMTIRRQVEVPGEDGGAGKAIVEIITLKSQLETAK